MNDVIIMVDLNEKCPTGIPGLDELMCGGFPRQRSILLSGTAGSGKTTLAVQFLYNGAVNYNEPGILISLEQDPKELRHDMKAYGFDLERLENEGKLIIIDSSLSRISGPKMDGIITPNIFKDQVEGSASLLPDDFNIEKILNVVIEKAQRIGAKRAVFDSLPALDFLIPNVSEVQMKHQIRQLLLEINYRLKAVGLTTILITEISDFNSKSTHGVESYVADGAINLYYTALGEESGRSLIIQKMRGTKHSDDVHPITFKEGIGIEVMKSEASYKV
jgi:KaiC/GvpD/RAD55 family RecA-like ATPase